MAEYLLKRLGFMFLILILISIVSFIVIQLPPGDYILSIGGLFSPEFIEAGWSFAKAVDLLKHLPVPIIVVGTAGTAGIIRIMRGCLLDELKKQYVITARAKGVDEKKLLFKYPVRWIGGRIRLWKKRDSPFSVAYHTSTRTTLRRDFVL